MMSIGKYREAFAAIGDAGLVVANAGASPRPASAPGRQGAVLIRSMSAPSAYPSAASPTDAW